MTRAVFAQRYHAGVDPNAISEPYAGTGKETYYRARREWFDACRECGNVTAHPDEATAQQAAATACNCGPAEPADPVGARGGKWAPDEDAVIVAVSDIDDAHRQLPHRTRLAIRKRRLRLEADGVTVTPINHPYMPKNPKPRKKATA